MTDERLAKLRAHITNGAMYYGADELLAEVDRLRGPRPWIPLDVAVPNCGIHVELRTSAGTCRALRGRAGSGWWVVPSGPGKAWSVLAHDVTVLEWR